MADVQRQNDRGRHETDSEPKAGPVQHVDDEIPAEILADFFLGCDVLVCCVHKAVFLFWSFVLTLLMIRLFAEFSQDHGVRLKGV